ERDQPDINNREDRKVFFMFGPAARNTAPLYQCPHERHVISGPGAAATRNVLKTLPPGDSRPFAFIRGYPWWLGTASVTRVSALPRSHRLPFTENSPGLRRTGARSFDRPVSGGTMPPARRNSQLHDLG